MGEGKRRTELIWVGFGKGGGCGIRGGGQVETKKKCMRVVITDQSKERRGIFWWFFEKVIMTEGERASEKGHLNTNYPDRHAIDFLSNQHTHKHRTHNLKLSNLL